MKITTTLILLGLGLLSRAQNARADAFLFSNGVYTTISPPSATILEVNGINDAGQIVGVLENNTGLHGFIDTNGVFTLLPPGTDPKGINNADQVVGVLGVDQGFLYSNGTFSAFDVPGGRINDVRGINDSGQIVGTFDAQFQRHGFIDSNGVFTSIDFPGAGGTSATGINAAGQIVGTRDVFFGFLDVNGTFSPIQFPGSTLTFVNGINNAGQILGFYESTSEAHDFLYSNGVYTTLPLDVPGSAPNSTRATGFNDVGQIVGTFSVPPPPTPEPAPFLLVACGLAGLASLSRLKRI
jgi:uncharacterized membrane protein